ncbi:MAG: PQQ-binding-like beta-propeller repeat protein [Haloarculaceae archaeon]
MTSRRQFLRAAAVAGTAGVAGCAVLVPQDESVPVDGEPAVEATAQFRGGLRRRGAATDRTVPDAVTVDWRLPGINTGEHTAAKASAVPTPDGDVVVPGDTGEIRRVAPDGTVLWQAAVEPARRGIHGTPAIANGAVYIGAYDGALYAFDLETGERYWRTKLGDAIGSSPGYRDGTVYIAVEYDDPSGAMFAVDAVTGDVVWEDPRPTDQPHSTCAIDRETDRLVVGSNDGTLYGWSYPDLDFRWSFPTGAPIKGPIAVDDGHAVFGSWSDRVYSVDLIDGSETWSIRTGGDVMSGAAIADGTVYIGCHDSLLYALDVADGTERWTFDTGGKIVGCPTVTADAVLVGSYDRRLYAIERASGRERWRVPASGWVTCEPLVTGDAVYATCRASNAYLEDGDGPTGTLYRIVAA